MISIDHLPHLPGCYLFLDSQGTIIYVGKARDLHRRVSNYFQKQDHGPKTEALVGVASSVDFIVTNTEVEALLLENTLTAAVSSPGKVDARGPVVYSTDDPP